MHRILLVDDNEESHQVIREALKESDIRVVTTVKDARNSTDSIEFDLVLLETTIASQDGLALAASIRQQQPHVALIILTKHGNLSTAIQAIDASVQAYLLKPIQGDELRKMVEKQIAKMQEVRRKEVFIQQLLATYEAFYDEGLRLSKSMALQSGQLTLDRDRYEAYFHGNDLQLSPAQFRVLWTLVVSEGQTVSPQTLVHKALGYETTETEAAKLIKGYISQIRRKVATYNDTREFIRTIRGQGYLWMA